MRVLVVDDVEDVRDLYRSYLEFQGVRVSTAADGVDAMRAIQEQRPDVVVLDCAMPRMTGWDVLRDLKLQPSTRGIRVVVLSGQNARAQALALGADCYLEKPCLPDVLFHEIQKVLRTPRGSTPRPARPPNEETVRCSSCRSLFVVEYYSVPGGTCAPVALPCPSCRAVVTATLKQAALLFVTKKPGAPRKLGERPRD
jgi:CheY-like chemotaxis protein